MQQEKPYYAHADTRSHIRHWVLGQMLSGAGKAALFVIAIGFVLSAWRGLSDIGRAPARGRPHSFGPLRLARIFGLYRPGSLPAGDRRLVPCARPHGTLFPQRRSAP